MPVIFYEKNGWCLFGIFIFHFKIVNYKICLKSYRVYAKINI